MNTNSNDPYAPADATPPTFGANGWMTVGGYAVPEDPSYNGWMTVGGYQIPDAEAGESL